MECPNTSGVRSPRERVLSLIRDLVNLRLPNLYICVTSRPEVDIRVRLEPLTHRRVSLHDQTGHKDDIAKYISSEVTALPMITDGGRTTRNWSSRHTLKKPMVCKVLLFSPRCFLSHTMIQVPMGVLSAGDAQALPQIEGLALSK